jgi:putative peptidoglycan lipid II flippase
VAGLTISAGLAGWLEFALLRHTLNRRIGRTGLAMPFTLKLWSAAGAGAAVGWAVKLACAPLPLHPAISAALILGPYGIVYFALTYIWRLPEAETIVGRLMRPLTRRRA